MTDWGAIIAKAEAERFVGREHELDLFEREIERPSPRYCIFYITGQGGVGKTTLLKRYQEIAKNIGFLVVECNEQQKDVPTVLGHFAQQLAKQHASLETFEKRYKVYRQHRHEIENDPEAPQGLAPLLGRAFVRATYVMGDLVPGLRKGLEYLPQETVEAQVSDWGAYLMKKLSNKDDVTLMRDPVSILTPLFFDDLNRVVSKQQVLLCFENFEATRQELQEWLLHLPEYGPDDNIRLVIAGRDALVAQWEPLRLVTKVISLDMFTEEEAELFLDVYEIQNEKKRTAILELSGRLPVLMSWLASAPGDEPDLSMPTQDIVERFLRWVTEPVWREIALMAAFPRTFNLDILQMLLNHENHLIDEKAAFGWLQSVPFVQACIDGWQYHSVVRLMMLRYQRRTSPHRYAHKHMILVEWYQTRRQRQQEEEDRLWTNELWRKDTLVYLYHILMADPLSCWSEVLDIFVIAMRKRREFAGEIIEMLHGNDVLDELQPDQQRTVQLFYKQFQIVKERDLQNGREMFECLCNIIGLSSLAKGYAFAFRGDCYRLNSEPEKALTDYETALSFNLVDVWTMSRRGITYRNMRRYEEALADLDRAIEIDERDAWVRGHRGITYLEMKRYEEALADLDRAIELDERDTWVRGVRGIIYREMKRYEEALADLDRAIELDEKSVWARGHRGLIYKNMKRYEEALADLDRAIELDEKDAWVRGVRGIIYREMKRYEEALADLDRAIKLYGQEAWARGQRGLTYKEMKRYEEALADLDRAIELDEKDTWVRGVRGIIYREMKRYEEALADLDRAIELDEKNAWARGQRGRTYREMKRYEEALADLDRAIELDEKGWIGSRGITYRKMKRYEEALADLDRAIELDEKGWIGSRGITYRKMKRYEEALADLDRAIELDEKGWIGSRGITYRKMKRYEEALADLNRAIELDEKGWIGSRGITYRKMKRYEEALADLDRAIELNEKNARARGQRGRTYREMKRYEEALADLDRAIELDEKDAWARGQRGRTYLEMKRYEEALADLDRAIELDERDTWVRGVRGIIYREMKRYEEALADLDRAIELDEKDAWVRGVRGIIYREMKRYEEALADLDRAIELDEENGWLRYLHAQIAYLIRQEDIFRNDIAAAVELEYKAREASEFHSVWSKWNADFNLALYHLCGMNSTEAQRFYGELIRTCTLIPSLQVALEDVEDLLTVQPANENIPPIQQQLQKRIALLEQSEE